MKRSLTTIFLFYLTIIFTYAQTERKEHFSFMNIPINGNINMFAQKLATKGIKVSPTNKVKIPLWLESSKVYGANAMLRL